MRLNLFRSRLNPNSQEIKTKFLKFAKIQSWVGKNATSHLNSIVNELSDILKDREGLDVSSLEEFVARLVYVSDSLEEEMKEKENLGYKKGAEEAFNDVKNFVESNLRGIGDSFS